MTYDSLFLHQSEDFTDPQYQRSQTDNDPPVFPTLRNGTEYLSSELYIQILPDGNDKHNDQETGTVL